MPFRMMTAGIVAALVVFTSNRVSGDDEGKTKRSDRKVLLELYTSQGCDACPPAAALLGELKGLGLGNDQIVPIAFHVDYLNDPWKDPFSAREFSKRQKSYNFVLERDDLYYTPMMMIDGHKSMLGSDRSKALAAIKSARSERPGVSLEIVLDRKNRKGSLSVKVAALSPLAIGRELLVGVAITEDPVATKVGRGKNAGKTLIEHHAVRSFASETIKLGRTETTTLDFPLELGDGWVDEHCHVAAFVQHRLNGRVYQADALPWTTGGLAQGTTPH